MDILERVLNTNVFFIVGNSRSGTTLVARILKSHPEIHVLNETHFMEEFVSERERFGELTTQEIKTVINRLLVIQKKDYYRKHEYEEYPDESEQIFSLFEAEESKSFANLILAFFNCQAKKFGCKIIGDQTPRHVFYISELGKMFPDAKFIHMIRDPRAILLSQKKKWQAGLRLKQPRFEVIRTFLNYHPVTTSFIWKKAINAGLTPYQQLPRDRILTIKFEDLVRDPEYLTKRICDFLKIEFNCNMLNVTVELSATKAFEGKRGIQKAIAERWKTDLPKTEVYICEQINRALMNDLGYPLTGVHPNILKLFVYVAVLPYQLGVAFILNLGRMGDPIAYIKKRLFN